MSTAIILGSARSDGNTHQLADRVAREAGASYFRLADYAIAPYDYEHRNAGDDFLPLMREVLRFDRIVLASPVYWYSPSSAMKVFLDRLSDLITIEKDLGRQLRQKQAALIATGCDAAAPACFETIFQATYAHLGMHYQGMLYCPCADMIELHSHRPAVESFAGRLRA